jgi:hypothetical protein
LEIENTVVWIERNQYKSFKKPGYVGYVPFRWTGLNNGLNLMVIHRKRRTERLGVLTNTLKFSDKGIPAGVIIECRTHSATIFFLYCLINYGCFDKGLSAERESCST